MTPDTQAALAWTLGAVVGTGAVVAALVAIARGIRGAYRLWRRVDRTATEILGEPADLVRGQERVPSMGERLGYMEKHAGTMCAQLGEVDARVSRIEHEMHPNAGHSLRDAVDRIETRTSRQE